MKKIIYDISSILEGMEEKTARTGIYFCAYNVLKILIQRNDVEVAFYISEPQWCYYEKKLQKMLNISDICVINSSKILTKFSKLWIDVYKKKIFYRENQKRIRAFLYRALGLVLRKITEIYELIIQNQKWDIGSFDFYFSPKRQAPLYILKNNKIKSVIVLHDVIAFIYPECFPKMNQKHWIKRLVASMNNEELFLANSQNTKKDFLIYTEGIIPQRIKVAYHACSEYFVPCHDEEKLLFIKHKYEIPDNKKYVFSLCTIEPRKNLIRIVKTFVEFIKKHQIEDLILVLGGGHWEKFIREFNASVGKIQNFSDIVYRVGYIDDEDLPYLYSGSLFFIYTSQYEGFGVPPLEAMKCGCPVIASNNSSIPEVVGDAGILIKWDNDEQHIQAYEKYYFNEAYRLEQKKRGLSRAEMFTWKKTVDNMLDEMEKDNKSSVLEY